jgi:hypothetical protein
VKARLLTSALSVLALAALGAQPAVAQPRTAIDGTYCGPGDTRPCVESASVQTAGGGVVAIGADDPTYQVYLSPSTQGHDHQVIWQIQPADATGSLPASAVFSITVNLGSIIPRTTDNLGSAMTVTRHKATDGSWRVTVSGHPTVVDSGGDCDQSKVPWTCPQQMTQDEETFYGGIDDFGQWLNVSQRNDFFGLDSFTNIEARDSPPQVTGDPPSQILVDLADAHELADGSTFHGFYDLQIPDAFLQDMGIDEPSTMTSSAVAGAASSGTVSLTPQGDEMHLAVTGIVFPSNPSTGHLREAHPAAQAKRFNSQRQVKLERGTVTPSRPTKPHAARKSSSRARITFTKSRARGSRIRSYQARCQAHGLPIRKASGNRHGVTIKSLASGRSYSCQVRAHAKAGYGHWSNKTHLKA